MEQLKPNCIVLSDLWGKRKAFPIKSHQQVLESHFRVHYYDSTALAEIPTHINTQDELHQAFIQGGLTKAVENLAQQKNRRFLYNRLQCWWRHCLAIRATTN